MSEPTCATCVYWHPEGEGSDTGHCRRSAPRLRFARPSYGDDDDTPAWPPTIDTDWCGEHRPGNLTLDLDGGSNG